MKPTMLQCKKRLAVLWLTGGGFLFLLFLLQSVFGYFAGCGMNARDAWGWLLPTIMPTLSLIVGVLAMEAATRNVDERRVDPFFFRLAIFLSLGYLLAVLLPLLLQPFSPRTPREIMDLANLWLGPLQGLTAATVGIFFTKGEKA